MSTKSGGYVDQVAAHQPRQFSLRSLFSAMSWTGVLLSVPGMLLLVRLIVVGIMLPAVLILGALLLVQLPFFLSFKLLVGPDASFEPDRLRR